MASPLFTLLFTLLITIQHGTMAIDESEQKVYQNR